MIDWEVIGIASVMAVLFVIVVVFTIDTYRAVRKKSIASRMAKNAIMTPNEMRVDSRVARHYDSSKGGVQFPLWGHTCVAIRVIVYLATDVEKCPVCGQGQSPAWTGVS